MTQTTKQGNKKMYDGYKSFQYLEAGVDYKEYKLSKENDRVEPYVYPVSADEEETVQEILEQDYIVSMHEHTFVMPENLQEFYEFRRQGRDWTGFEALSQSGLDVIFENFMDGTAMITSQAGWKWSDVIHDLGIRFSDIAHQDMVIKAERISDLYRAKKEGKIAFVGALESSTMIENELDRLDVLYGFGIRTMGIVYSEANQLGAGLREPNDGGLTVFGKQAVRRMNKLGITIDVSHAGDKTSLDTIEASEKPVTINHAGARALWDTKRLKPDDVIKACAEKGGVIAIEAAPHSTITHNHPAHNIESFMEHFEYTANLVGIDHVAFGPDTLFGDHVGVHDLLAGQLSIKSAQMANLQKVEYVKGLENPAECFPNIVRWLVKKGYSREEIRKVVGGNIFRVLEATWAK
ncbi:dipeptidase [Cytobacillus solani]|uniref:Diguanylate cyclase n=1 Tax=Cytobacillus solani TaxID=1637975 RepID=A0A0Q3VJK3_9BACI|nr:membrane dipeptidase [Cytobacillus solani]KOP71903.1 diguanylate cyclase [Bacillus sp. FJAT-21945]KQL21435.1 diguanylate cyclase [Cytobacillus solani]USK54737.1 dipeptidase [Cytobacillus solani]